MGTTEYFTFTFKVNYGEFTGFCFFHEGELVVTQLASFKDLQSVQVFDSEKIQRYRHRSAYDFFLFHKNQEDKRCGEYGIVDSYYLFLRDNQYSQRFEDWFTQHDITFSEREEYETDLESFRLCQELKLVPNFNSRFGKLVG